jgi:capsular polysaccharide biosynthesis protein
MHSGRATVLRGHEDWLARADAIVVPADIEPSWRDLPWRFRPYLASVPGVTLLGGEWLLYAEQAGLLIDTLHQSLAAQPWRSAWLAGAEQREGDDGGEVLLRMPREVMHVAEPCVLLGSRPLHYHWLVDYLPRLKTIGQQPALDGLRLVVGADIAPAQLEALSRLGVDTSRLLRLAPDAACRFDTLWVPSLWSDQYHLHPAALLWLRRTLLGRAGLAHDGSRLFVSRQDAALRHIVNEEQVAAMLARHGFRTILAGGLSFSEQMALFSRAQVVVGGTGSGLSNIVFAPTDSVYVELHNYPKGAEFIRFLAAQMGQRYERVVGTPVADTVKLPHNRDFVIDMAQLEAVIVPLLV